MDIPSWRIAFLTVMAFSALSSNPPAVAMAPGKAAAAATASPASAISYEIRTGDTAWSIAQQFRIDWDQLLELNPSIRATYPLQKGMKVMIPVHTSFTPISQPVMNVEKPIGYTRSGELLQFTRILNCTITAYTAGPESTGKRPGDPGYGITASGTRVQEGRTIAVDPELIPIGSKVYIAGIGYRIAEDTGAAIRGEHIDLFLNDYSAALAFGVQNNVQVYILNG